MTFSAALEQLKGGRRITRGGWHGKGAFLYLLELSKATVTGDATAEIAELLRAGGCELAGLEPCIAMRTSDGKHQPGWLASQADMLADDWSLA